MEKADLLRHVLQQSPLEFAPAVRLAVLRCRRQASGKHVCVSLRAAGRSRLLSHFTGAVREQHEALIVNP